MAVMTIKAKQLRCEVCGHEWVSRIEKLPVKCPNQKCQSPNWNEKQK